MRLRLAVRSGMLRLRARVGSVRALRGAGGGRWRGGGGAHAAHASAVEPSAVRGLRGTAPRGRRYGVKLILLLDASVGGTSGGRHLRVVPGEVCVAGRHGSRPGDVARLAAALRLGLGGGRVGGPVGARAPGIARAVSHLTSATRRRGRGRGAHASGAHARGGLVGVKGAGRGAGGAGGSAVVASVRLRGRVGERVREVNQNSSARRVGMSTSPADAGRGETRGGGRGRSARRGERGARDVPGESPGDCLGRATWWVRPWSCACSGCVRCDRRARRGGRSRCPRRGSGRRRRGSCAGEWWPGGSIGRDSSVRRDRGSDARVARRLGSEGRARARDAPRNVRPGMRGIAEWISRVAKTYRRAGAGSPATLASHGLGPRVSHRGLLRSCVYRGGSVRRAREMPPGDAAPPATTGETPLFLVSCFETPAFRAIRRISENRGAPRAFFHVTSRPGFFPGIDNE